MTVKDRDTLRGLFESGDQPTGENFSDLIDSYLSISPGSTQQTVPTCIAFTDIKADEVILRNGTTEHGRIRYNSSAAATVIEGWNGSTWTETIRSGNDGTLGFFGSVGASRPAVTGAIGGFSATTQLSSAMAAVGLVTESLTTAARVYSPIDYGAVGDGSTIDTTALRTCVSSAESHMNSTVLLNPQYAFAIDAPVTIGNGTYPITVRGTDGHFSHAGGFSIKKAADTVAFVMPHNSNRAFFDGVSVLGLAGTNVSASADGSPAMLIHTKVHMRDCSFYKCGGLATGVSTAQTDGYVIGIIQLSTIGNCNTCLLDNVDFHSCSGDGVYIKNNTPANNNPNVNAIRVTERLYYNSTGFAVNAISGFRNSYIVNNYACVDVSSPGVFRLGYVENYAEVIYTEGGTTRLVDFAGSGGRNMVKARDFSTFTILTSAIRNNTIQETLAGNKTYLGDGSASTDTVWSGSEGIRVDAIKLPAVQTSAYAKLSNIDFADYGDAFNISGGSGAITWTSRFGQCARVGPMAMFYISLIGEVATTATNSSLLTIDSSITGLSYYNGTNFGGPATGLMLTNSAATARPVMLMYYGTTGMRICEAGGTIMPFNAVTGVSAFKLEGTICLLGRQGMSK